MDSAAQSGPLIFLLFAFGVGCVPLTSDIVKPLPVPSAEENDAGEDFAYDDPATTDPTSKDSANHDLNVVSIDDVTQSSFEIEAFEIHPDDGEAYTLDEIVAISRTTHPRALGALRAVDQANAEIEVAELRSNPDLVLDVDTPVNGENDRTELSARLTFPIGPANRKARVRVARARSMTASARYRDVLRQVEEAALDAAIDVVYLQERLVLEEESDRIARERAELLLPQLRDGDAGDNLTDSLSAKARADRASESLLETRRELALARLNLVESLGVDLSRCPTMAETIWVQGSVADVSLELPSLQDAIATALAESPLLLTRSSEVNERWLQQQAERDRTRPWKIGPRYDDELGDDGDRVGVRIRRQVALNNRHQRTRARAAEFDARVAEELLSESRNEVARQVAGGLQELRLIAERLAQLRNDQFVEEQESRLEDPTTTDGMTGEQVLRIEEAIVDRKKAKLELEYRFKRLHSRLGLHAVVEQRVIESQAEPSGPESHSLTPEPGP